MIYKEKTTLFDVDNIDFEALLEKVKGSKVEFNFGLKGLECLKNYLAAFKAESMVCNKENYPIDFSFELTTAKKTVIKINISSSESKIRLVPHLYPAKCRFEYINELESFYKSSTFDAMHKSINTIIKTETASLQCKDVSRKVLNVISKVDTLFKCNEEMYKKVYNYGLYCVDFKLKSDLFSIKFSTRNVVIESKSCDSSKHYKRPYISLETNFDSDIITLSLYNQRINLSYTEFMEADYDDLEKSIVSILKLKKIEISDIEDLRNELILEEMKMF